MDVHGCVLRMLAGDRDGGEIKESRCGLGGNARGLILGTSGARKKGRKRRRY